MRGLVILLVVLLVGAGAWFGLQSSAGDDPIEAEPGSRGEPDAAETDVDPLAAERSRRDTERAETERTDPQRRFTVAVTLVAHAAEPDGSPGPELKGLTYRLSDGESEQPIATGEANSGHTLRLAPGTYALQVSLEGFIAPAPARFTIDRDSEPRTLRFPFRAIEATLVLEVLDRTTRQRIDEFRVTVEVEAPGREKTTVHIPTPESNPLSIPTAPGHRVTVTVEAKGYTPAEPIRVEFDDTTAKIERQVYLAAAMRFTGVELRVTDEASQAVKSVLVAAHARRPDGSYRRVWRRRAAREDGRYRLPDLAPGSYRMQVHAADDKGIPTLLVGHEFEFEFTGSEHVIENVTLKAGAGIELRLSDSSGNRIGKDVAVQLLSGTEARETTWRPIVEGSPAPEAPLSIDHLLRDAPARLEYALAPGRYTLKLRLGDGPVVTRALYLTAGQTERVELQLSK